MIPRAQAINWIRYLIDSEGFEAKNFLLTAPRTRPWPRERRRQQILQLMNRNGLSAQDLVTPPAPTNNSLLFIAKFENGHETCTAVFGMPDKPGLQRGIRLAQRAFTALMHTPPSRIIAARFEINSIVLAHYNADEIASAIMDSELPPSSGADGGKFPRAVGDTS